MNTEQKRETYNELLKILVLMYASAKNGLSQTVGKSASDLDKIRRVRLTAYHDDNQCYAIVNEVAAVIVDLIERMEVSHDMG